MKTKHVNPIKTLLISTSLTISVSACQVNEQPTVSPYSIAYSSKESGNREIYLSDAKGKAKIKITSHTKSDGYPAVSPDGKSMVFYGKYDGNKTWSIHLVSIDGNNIKRLTTSKHKWDSAPTWSPDGEKIAFARAYKNTAGVWQEEIWLMNADGGEQVQIEQLEGGGPNVMQDGRILFHTKTDSSEISIADSDGSNIIELTKNNAQDWYPDISPDGRQIAFMSDRDGNKEIYTMNVDGSNQKRLTFNDVEDWNPAWSPDGSKLIFTSENNNDFFDIYMMNKDGSSVKKIINNGSQASWIYNANTGD